ncbi:efflux RND transporter periplasmic adaptor subunit [Croceicoccus hydrothermalis]|uniref:efflux RND transporter periplasmic adaptor subunit n=1 Tax=Croceicoccus hydrothermalis TaxID=2867964 RepID=UPI001EFA34AA|nr:efflux RND transporter periplasmic adaptor subunit [Croceicoccus hydrothermalis]
MPIPSRRNLSRALAPILLGFAFVLSGCGDGQSEAESSTQAPAASVRIARASDETIQSYIYAQGTARATRREFLSFQQAGRVTYIAPGLDAGSPVRRGQLIARIEPARAQSEAAQAEATLAGARTELTASQASLNEAQAQLELARATFERYRVLLAQDSASQQEYDEAEAQLAQARAAVQQARAQVAANRAQIGSARAQRNAADVTVSETRIVSPISGTLARLNIERGRYFSPEYVQAGDESSALSTVPALVIDASQYEITVDIPSFSASGVTVGDDVLIRSNEGMTNAQPGSKSPRAPANTPPLPDQEFVVRGRVTAISPSLDPLTRTFQAKIRTVSGAGELRDGEFVSLWISGAEAQEALAIPLGAIRFQNNRPFAFVYDPKKGTVVRRDIEVGRSGTDVRAVLSGIRKGEWVVYSGNGRLSGGDRVRILSRSARSAGATGDLK